MKLPGAVSTARLPERVRTLATLVNLHYAGAGLLLLINLYLALQLGLAWHTTSDSGAQALALGQIALKTADLQARPLQGLDSKLAAANAEADTFYVRRLPGSYSQVLTELGALTKREGVKLTRGQYAQAPILADTSAALTEMRMDFALTGDYRSLVHMVNALERDRMFFLIRGVALTGQQAGTVGLRLGLNTYLRPGAVLDAALPLSGATAADAPADSLGSAAGRTNLLANPRDPGRKFKPGDVTYSEGGPTQ
jgi:type IV pilus assembly protein PilO